MAMREHVVHHRTFTCDKCGHTEMDDNAGPQTPHIDQTKWMTVQMSEPGATPSPGNPLGQGGGRSMSMFVCPGCRGLFEAFLEIDWTKSVSSYGAATQAMPPKSLLSQQSLAKIARDLGLGHILQDPDHKVIVK